MGKMITNHSLSVDAELVRVIRLVIKEWFARFVDPTQQGNYLLNKTMTNKAKPARHGLLKQCGNYIKCFINNEKEQQARQRTARTQS